MMDGSILMDCTHEEKFVRRMVWVGGSTLLMGGGGQSDPAEFSAPVPLDWTLATCHHTFHANEATPWRPPESAHPIQTDTPRIHS
jgi:hypothetical protein